MNDFVNMMAAIYQGFQLSFTVYGFTFTLWEIFLFSAISSVVAWFIGRLLAN